MTGGKIKVGDMVIVIGGHPEYIGVIGTATKFLLKGRATNGLQYDNVWRVKMAAPINGHRFGINYEHNLQPIRPPGVVGTVDKVKELEAV